MAFRSKVGKAATNPYRFFTFHFPKAPFRDNYLSKGQVITNDSVAPGMLPSGADNIRFIILTDKMSRTPRVFYPNDFIASFGDKCLSEVILLLI